MPRLTFLVLSHRELEQQSVGLLSRKVRVQVPDDAPFRTATINQEQLCKTNIHTNTRHPFEVISKRRRGFPSETRVKKGCRVVHGEKELAEKLGRNDLCPCGSRRRL